MPNLQFCRTHSSSRESRSEGCLFQSQLFRQAFAAALPTEPDRPSIQKPNFELAGLDSRIVWLRIEAGFDLREFRYLHHKQLIPSFVFLCLINAIKKVDIHLSLLANIEPEAALEHEQANRTGFSLEGMDVSILPAFAFARPQELLFVFCHP